MGLIVRLDHVYSSNCLDWCFCGHTEPDNSSAMVGLWGCFFRFWGEVSLLSIDTAADNIHPVINHVAFATEVSILGGSVDIIRP